MPEPTPIVDGVLLAAGQSRRLGGEAPKQLLPIEGVPLVRRTANTALASGLRRLIVVLGHRTDEVAGALADLDVEIVHNERYADGQSTSVVRGLEALPVDTDAALFLPCDQPFLTAGLVDRLLVAHRESGRQIVVPKHRDRRGAPVLFARPLFPELMTLQGDEGGRQILRRHRNLIHPVEVEDPRALLDIDTAEDLRRLGLESGT